VGATDNALFAIQSNQLVAAASLNFESQSSYSVRVRSTDQGGLSTEKVFTISVTNVNEAPSDIAISAAVVAENQPSGTNVGALSTTDPDATNTFTYTLVSGTGSTDNASFTIQGNQLVTASSFNFETQSSYFVRVRSTDQGGLLTEKVFTISVTNVNEAPADIAISGTSVPENQAIGTTVGTLSSVDPDVTSAFNYALVSGVGSTDNASYSIQGNQLVTAASLNFESQSTYSIRIRSTDQGGLSTEKVFTISATNINESPSDISLTAAVVAENRRSGTAVGTLATIDQDAAEAFTYALVGGLGATDNALFAIEGNQLVTAASFNFEAQLSYSVRVRSTDQGGLSTDKVFTIAVTNVNEAPTDIAISTAVLPENQPAGTAVGMLSATDPDAASTFTYSLVDGAGSIDNASFAIVGNELVTARSFNFETNASYSIRVRATDFLGLSTEKPLAITVTDVVVEPFSVESVAVLQPRSYRAGEVLRIPVVLTGNATVTGKPTLPFTIGKTKAFAAYESGSGTNRLVFSYKVGNKDNANGLTLGSAITLPTAATRIRDAANNPLALTLPGGVGFGKTILDTVAPTVAITSNKASIKGGESSTISFSLSETSADFTLADISATGGTLSQFNGSGGKYSAVFTPAAGSTVPGGVTIAAGRFTDAAGNPSAIGKLAPAIKIDTAPPTVRISSSGAALASGKTATVTFTLSEASTNFTASDVAVGGGTLSAFAGKGTAYTATFTPSRNSTVPGTVTVAVGAFSDTAGNINVGPVSLAPTIKIDTSIPTVAIGSSVSSLRAGETARITFSLSESSTDFTAADVNVAGGTLSRFTGSGASYSAVFTPRTGSTAPGTVAVAASKFKDVAGNLNFAGRLPAPLAINTVVPTVRIATNKTTLKTNETATITFKFSEPVAGFTLEDVRAAGGTLSSFSGAGANYSAILTPIVGSLADCTVSVVAGSFTNAAGNTNAATVMATRIKRV
jgi:hypothetical protein